MILAAHAAHLLQENGTHDERLERYNTFVENYARAVHNSWYVSTKPPDNILFGYSVREQIGGGAFGTVFRAEAESGAQVAIKLLLYEIRGHREMLGSFRRGVRSMRILSEAGVKGTVPYLHAYELPPCTVMELVDGPNLEVAVKSGFLDKWHDGLRIAADVCEIVRRGHNLPQRVLHRDIRPANIMLRNFYNPELEWEVVVLDFDLSWHRGAMEKSLNIRAESGIALGYLAPEQLIQTTGVSTRSALVDSFGFGMTLYFIFCGQHPGPNESSIADWPGHIHRAIRDTGSTRWSSLPFRIARLIDKATQPKQHQRLDMAQIQWEIGRLREVLVNPQLVASAELWAEEILSGAFPNIKYEWDTDLLVGKIKLVSGVQMEFRGEETEGSVIVTLTWLGQAEQEWRRVDRWVRSATDKSASLLRKGGWEVQYAEGDGGSIRVTARIGVPLSDGADSRAVSSVREAANALSFE